MKWSGWVTVFLTTFLASRYSFEGGIVPFALASILFWRHHFNHSGRASVPAAVAGAATVSLFNAAAVLLQWLLYLTVERLTTGSAHRIGKRIEPIVAGGSVAGIKLALILSGVAAGKHVILYGILESLTAALTVLMIRRCDRMFTGIKTGYRPGSEEFIVFIGCLAVLSGGLHSLELPGITLSGVAVYAAVLLLSASGGSFISAVAALVMAPVAGIVAADPLLSVPLLAAAGFFGGLLRSGGTVAVVSGFWIGALSAVVFDGTLPLVQACLVMLTATGTYLILPEKWETWIAAHFSVFPYEYAEPAVFDRSVRSRAVTRIRQFAALFRQLGGLFRQLPVQEKTAEDSVTGDAMSMIMERHCQSCTKRTDCWERQFAQTSELMTGMISAAGHRSKLQMAHELPVELSGWSQDCFQAESVWNSLHWFMNSHKQRQYFHRQIGESRQVVVRQLFGVSEMMDQLAGELVHERQREAGSAEQIRAAIREAGISLRRLQLISLGQGEVQILADHTFPAEQDPCRTMLAPVFSMILQDNVCLLSVTNLDSQGILKRAHFGSVKQFQVAFGMAGRAKHGGVYSGDSYFMIGEGGSRAAMALSDGMGSGSRAFVESRNALGVLEQLLLSGMEHTMAVRSVNSVLMLRSEEEMYATLDLASFDLNRGIVTLLKNGASPGFIKRGSELIVIHSPNVPLGIVPDMEPDLVRFQLVPGDWLILMSDGVEEMMGWMVDKERYLRQMILEMAHAAPQQAAEWLIDRICGTGTMGIKDDITVLIASVGKEGNTWATVNVPSGKMLRHIHKARNLRQAGVKEKGVSV